MAPFSIAASGALTWGSTAEVQLDWLPNACFPSPRLQNILQKDLCRHVYKKQPFVYQYSTNHVMHPSSLLQYSFIPITNDDTGCSCSILISSSTTSKSSCKNYRNHAHFKSIKAFHLLHFNMCKLHCDPTARPEHHLQKHSQVKVTKSNLLHIQNSLKSSIK